MTKYFESNFQYFQNCGKSGHTNHNTWLKSRALIAPIPKEPRMKTPQEGNFSDIFGMVFRKDIVLLLFQKNPEKIPDAILSLPNIERRSIFEWPKISQFLKLDQ